MISVPFGCPEVVDVWLNQMSYAASLAEPEGWVMETLVVAEAILLSSMGNGLEVVQSPQ
jgi:hypothetical protein